MKASYHNHSTWSDGRASVGELVAAARGFGLDELGISDHYFLPPPGADAPAWSLSAARLPRYLAELRSHAGATDPVVRVGIEVDWIGDRAGDIASAIEALGPVDYVIGSVHEVDGFIIDSSPEPWRRLERGDGPFTIDEAHRRSWLAVADLASSGLFDIMAHIDLPKKFAFHPCAQPDDAIDAALDAIAASKMVVELNTAGWHKPCRDAYPTVAILRRCRERGIGVTISADAHKAEDLVRDFRRAAARLQEAGYDGVARFRAREVTMVPLASAIAGLPAEPSDLEPDDF